MFFFPFEEVFEDVEEMDEEEDGQEDEDDDEEEEEEEEDDDDDDEEEEEDEDDDDDDDDDDDEEEEEEEEDDDEGESIPWSLDVEILFLPLDKDLFPEHSVYDDIEVIHRPLELWSFGVHLPGVVS